MRGEPDDQVHLEALVTAAEAPRCIRHTHSGQEWLTWCGRWRQTGEWVFVNIDHAVYARRDGSRIAVCPRCRAEVINVLQEGSR